MHHLRLVGGLAAFAFLLTLTVAQVAVAAKASSHPVDARAATIAKRCLGVPYVFGGAGPTGFDASGLTKYVFGKLGVELPHGATDQQRLSKRVSLAKLRRGDLVFWGSRSYSYLVGIYAALTDTDHAGVLRDHGGQGFGTFKGALADLLVAHLSPIAAETRRLLQDRAALDAVLRDGAQKAAAIAEPIVSEAERLVGFLKV